MHRMGKYPKLQLRTAVPKLSPLIRLSPCHSIPTTSCPTAIPASLYRCTRHVAIEAEPFDNLEVRPIFKHRDANRNQAENSDVWEETRLLHRDGMSDILRFFSSSGMVRNGCMNNTLDPIRDRLPASFVTHLLDSAVGFTRKPYKSLISTVTRPMSLTMRGIEGNRRRVLSRSRISLSAFRYEKRTAYSSF